MFGIHGYVDKVQRSHDNPMRLGTEVSGHRWGTGQPRDRVVLGARVIEERQDFWIVT